MNESQTTTPAQRKRGWFGQAFALFAGSYGLLITALLMLRLVIGDEFLPVAIYSTLAQWLWLGALFLLVAALLVRSWRTLPFLLLPAAAWILIFGLRFLNSGEEARRSGETLTVATYNIQWRTDSYTGTISLIRAMDADIVALQEISPEAAQTIEDGLLVEYPYMALDPLQWGYSGQALLSKYPIKEHEFFEFGVNPTSFGQQRVVVEHPEGDIVVYNVHLLHPLTGGLNFAPRANEMRALHERIRAEQTRHLIVMGDFNMSDQNEDYAVIDGVMRDAYRDVGTGLGLTHTLRLRGVDIMPWMRLDYIFTQGGLDALDARVMPTSGGSDHAPVWARLEIYDPSASYPDL